MCFWSFWTACFSTPHPISPLSSETSLLAPPPERTSSSSSLHVYRQPVPYGRFSSDAYECDTYGDEDDDEQYIYV